MGKISSLFERRFVSSLAQPAAWLIELFGGTKTASGVHVTEEKALTLPAVWSAVNRISSTVASLPLHVYRRRETGKEKATQHPVYTLLHDAPNPHMTAMQFRRALTAHALLWGNGYAWIQRDPNGVVQALWPLSPAITQPMWAIVDGEKRVIYTTAVDGQPLQLMDYEVLHIAGLGFDGLRGYSVIAMEREAVGLGLAMQEMTGWVVANNAVPPIVLRHPGKPDFETQQRIVEAFMKGVSGENRGKVGIVAEGIDIKELGMPLKDAEFLAQRNYTVLDIARIFNIPATMLEGADKAPTYASAEQFNLWFVQHTIRPWLVAWEQAISLRLFTGLERKRYFAEHSVEGLLRGDSAARAEFYNKMFQIGVFSINDIRELENQNSIGPEGDKHFVPLNMVPLGSALPEPKVQRDLATILSPVIEHIHLRIIRRIKADVTREVEKRIKNGDWDGLLVWIDNFCTDHFDFSFQNLLPVGEALGKPVDVILWAKNHAETVRKLLKTAIFEAKIAKSDPISAINELFSRWQANPGEVFPDD